MYKTNFETVLTKSIVLISVENVNAFELVLEISNYMYIQFF